MFISDVSGSYREELQNLIVQELRHYGIKHRIKKTSVKNPQHAKQGRGRIRLFQVPLNDLDHEVVLLNCGSAVEVPSFVTIACSFIRQAIQTEGIFRKAGSTARQKELKALLDAGKNLGPEHQVIEVANILKLFFRELPEPLLPRAYHDTLLRCLLKRSSQAEGILLTCLLLPTIHVSTLTFLMQFLQEVAAHSNENRMDVKNLAIVFTPSLMPVEENSRASSRITHHVQVVELLISHADKIGILPEFLAEKIATHPSGHSWSNPSISNDEQDSDSSSRQSKKKKKKRRSGSLTRMLNGFKKMVGKGTPEVEESHLITSTPDISTPCMKSTKKRKAAEGASAFSSKKNPRKIKSPQSAKSRHRRFFSQKLQSESSTSKSTNKDSLSTCKKNRLSVGSWSGKKQKSEELPVVCNPFGSDVSCHSDHASRSSLEKSWSTEPWSRKKPLNLSDVPMYSPSIGAGVDITSDDELAQTESKCNTFSHDDHVNLFDSVTRKSDRACSDTEFVRIPKSEYEEIKSRVSAIENRISQEFGNITKENESATVSPVNISCDIGAERSTNNNNAELVQSAYERTLEESEKLDDASADHLARRLSKELRIRRSLENKVIRSPSARKIGTIRRRSKENAKSFLRKSPEGRKVERNMSWHLAVRPSLAQIGQLYPRSNLKRGRPNTILTGLPHPSPRNAVNVDNFNLSLKYQQEAPKDVKIGFNEVSDYQFCLMDENYDESMFNTLDMLQYSDFCRQSGGGPITRSKARRASSFHGTEWVIRNRNFRNTSFKDVKKSNSHGDIAPTKAYNSVNFKESCDIHNKDDDEKKNEWVTAESFFRSGHDVREVPVTGRASVARIRSQNAGMVLERMKLFDAKASCSSLVNDDKEKLVSKSKKHVQVPPVFTLETEFLEQHSRSAPPKKHSPLISKSGMTNVRATFKDSPKKIGTPRRKQTVKSPNSSLRKQKLKILSSPSVMDPVSPGSIIRRKHNSLKLARDRICTNVKVNRTVPVNWLSTEKENVLSPADNSYVVLTPRSQICRDEIPINFSEVTYSDSCKEISSPALCLMSISPLKDSNRIDATHIPVSLHKDMSGYRTPRETPYIKKALLTKSPSHFTRTPQSSLKALDRSGRRHHTPMKALTDYNSVGTPVGSPRRQSPRLLLLKSRNIS